MPRDRQEFVPPASAEPREVHEMRMPASQTPEMLAAPQPDNRPDRPSQPSRPNQQGVRTPAPREVVYVSEKRSGHKAVWVVGTTAVTAAAIFFAHNMVTSADERAGAALRQQQAQTRVSTPPHTLEATQASVVPTTQPTPATSQTPMTTAPTTRAPEVVVPTEAACVGATPNELKITQQLMLPISSSSNFAEAIKLQKEHPTNWTVANAIAPDKLSKLQNAQPDIRARLATNNEGGVATLFKNPDAAALPSLADVETGKISAADYKKLLDANLAFLKKSGIYMNLAPVVDRAAKAGQENGRMFADAKKAEAYLATYLEAAKNAGMYATLKHFPDGLRYGNTNKLMVKTAPYGELEKSGVLDAYKSLNVPGNKNWAMISSSTTPGLPDAKLDNKKINAFNPAAYAALNKLTGGAPVVAGPFSPGVKALNGMPVDKAVLAALEAGANMVLVGAPDSGKTLPQEVKTTTATLNAALKSGELSAKTLDASYLKVLGNKGLSACDVLQAYDGQAYVGLMKLAPAADAAPTATASPSAKTTAAATGTPTPGKPAASAAPAAPKSTAARQTLATASRTK